MQHCETVVKRNERGFVPSGLEESLRELERPNGGGDLVKLRMGKAQDAESQGLASLVTDRPRQVERLLELRFGCGVTTLVHAHVGKPEPRFDDTFRVGKALISVRASANWASAFESSLRKY